MSYAQAFAHKSGALGGGNDVAEGQHSIEEAAERCIKLGAAGFTHQGPANPRGRVLCYFKSNAAGNNDASWQTYTPHLKHKVGALGGGGDVDAGNYTLAEAWVHCLSLPNAVGFTFQGPPSPPGKVMVYFKSNAAGNADGNWQTYLKSPNAPTLRGRPIAAAMAHRGGGGRPMTPREAALPAGVALLSKNHVSTFASFF